MRTKTPNITILSPGELPPPLPKPPPQINVERIDRAIALHDYEVAWLLGVSADTVRNLHRIGRLKGVMIGKHLRWRPGDVQTYVRELMWK